MSARALKALLGTVAGLLIIWLAVTFLPRGGGGPDGSSEGLTAFFQGATPNSLSAVRFTDPVHHDAIELRRAGAEWKVNGFRADSAVLARFWETLGEAKIGDLVAANPANHSRMGLAGDSAWTLELESEAGSRSLLVGDAGSRYGTTFVRLPGEDNVHLLEGNLRPQVTRPLDDWRNKRVATVDTAGVWRIEVEREGDGFVLQRSDSVWVLQGGAQADPTPVRAMLGEMARMDASGFFPPGDSLSARAGTVRALDQAGELRLALDIGSDEGDRWVRAAGDSIIYRIPSWRAARIFPDSVGTAGGG